MSDTVPDSSQPSPATPAIPRQIWVLVAAAFIIALGYGLIAPLLPQFVVSFDVSMAAAGLVVSIFSASRLLFAPASGYLVNRIGSRRIYLTGLLTVAVMTGLVSLAQAYWHIIALRFLAGIGSTMFTVSAMGLIVSLSPAQIRGRCSALYGTAFLLGNIAGPLLGAGLAFLGFRWPFFIYGLGVALAAGVVWWLMPRSAGTGNTKSSLPPMHLAQAWQDTAFRAALTSSFAHGWVNMGVRVSVIPLFAAAVFANSSAAAGYALAAFAAGNAVVLQFSGRWADTFGRRPMILAGLCGSAVFTWLLGHADSLPLLIGFSVLTGAAAGFINPAQQATLADIIGSERSGGQVLSSFQMAMDLGSIFGPVVVGALADIYGFQTAFAVSGAVALVGVVAWSFSREPLPSTQAKLRVIPCLIGGPRRPRRHR